MYLNFELLWWKEISEKSISEDWSFEIKKLLPQPDEEKMHGQPHLMANQDKQELCENWHYYHGGENRDQIISAS